MGETLGKLFTKFFCKKFGISIRRHVTLRMTTFEKKFPQTLSKNFQRKDRKIRAEGFPSDGNWERTSAESDEFLF